MIFSYSLKHYDGIRPETEINRIMQKYSKKTYESVEDTSYYSYTRTGDFRTLFGHSLVFKYEGFYVLYDLESGAYRKIRKKSSDFLYLERFPDLTDS